MAKVATAPVGMDEPVVEVPAPATGKKTYTNWAVFDKAKLVPTQLVCDVIRLHPADEACKTRLVPAAKNIIDHINAGHGGGFAVRVKQTDGKAWAGWKELADAGVELAGLQCEVCDGKVQLSVRDINNHLKPHKGKFRGAYQNFNSTFFMTLQFGIPTNSDEDEAEFE